MNYRHAFHAGNFADVCKHAVLCRILTHLRGKETPFRVIDTHAGAGLYDLTGSEASRGGEWRDGIGKLIGANLYAEERELLAPYLEVIAALNEPGELKVYPGSPAIARAWLRPQDRLIACEVETQARRALTDNLKSDIRIKAIDIDGWTALGAYVPPKERRGVVLVDPPFEQPDEFIRLAQTITEAHRKWPTGIYTLWYPIKEREAPDRLAKAVKRLGGKSLRAELFVARLGETTKLAGSGLIVINPPWTLHDDLRILLPAFAKLFEQTPQGGAFRLDWLASEAA